MRSVAYIKYNYGYNLKNATNEKKNVENIKMTKFEAPGRMKFYNGLIKD